MERPSGEWSRSPLDEAVTLIMSPLLGTGLIDYTKEERAITHHLLPPTLSPLSGVGTTCFLSCCDKDSAIIFTTARLPDVNPP
jgi:hypothetical protein